MEIIIFIKYLHLDKDNNSGAVEETARKKGQSTGSKAS